MLPTAGIDLVGGATAHHTFDLVRNGGRCTTSVPGRMADVLDLAARGILPIEQTYTLEHATAAHECQAAGRLRGRVGLVP